MISVDILEGAEAIEVLTAEWDLLVGDSYTASFSRPYWYLAWIDAFRPKRIAIVTARDENRLVGILPLARLRTDARGLYFTLVAPFARGDYQPPIVEPETAPVALPAMLDAAFRQFGHRGVYWWPNIPSSDPSLDILRSFFAARGMPCVEEWETAPRLRIEGASFPAVEHGWAASHRKDIRRQCKRLSEHAPVSLWQPETLAEAEPVLVEFFRVHDEKWLAQGFPGMFQQPSQRLFFQAAMRRLWGRGLHFSTVRCGSTDVSYHFGLFAGGWLQWYRPTYRSDFGGFSPSKIHVAMLIEEACRSKWTGMDFLLGAEAYKDLWSNEATKVVSIHAGFHQSAPSYFWFTQGKPFARCHFQLAHMRARAWFQKRRQEFAILYSKMVQHPPSCHPSAR
jgi:CelD/BcsL family acetyltransferase involved in cellulose biosynthesis